MCQGAITQSNNLRTKNRLRVRKMINNILRNIILLNGVYDLICFIGIMWFHRIPGFSRFHLDVFRDAEQHPLVRRLLAYWVLTYGVVRVCAGLFACRNRLMDVTAALTYMIEIFGFEYELCVEDSVISYKVTAITLMSIPIAATLLLCGDN